MSKVVFFTYEKSYRTVTSAAFFGLTSEMKLCFSMMRQRNSTNSKSHNVYLSQDSFLKENQNPLVCRIIKKLTNLNLLSTNFYKQRNINASVGTDFLTSFVLIQMFIKLK